MQKVHAMLITITKENKSYGGGYEALGSQSSNAHPPSSCLVSLNEWIATDMASRKKKWIQATRKMIALIFLNSLFGTRRNYEVCMMDDKRKRRDIVIITGRMDGTPCRDSLKTRESRVAKEYHPIFPDSPKNTRVIPHSFILCKRSLLINEKTSQKAKDTKYNFGSGGRNKNRWD